MGGKAILDSLRSEMAKARLNVTAVAHRDDLPIEHRRRVRQEAETATRALVGDALNAFREWAASEEATAKAALKADPVRSPAEETRALRREMEYDRLIASANASGTPRTFAQRYASTATDAYMDSDYERAVLYARAAVELGSPFASGVLASAQAQLDLADPVKGPALKAMSQAKVGTLTFERDVSADLSAFLRAIADAAHVVGDDPRSLLAESTRLSLAAKGAALELANETSTAYTEPENALSGVPATALRAPGTVTRTRELDPETGVERNVTRVTS